MGCRSLRRSPATPGDLHRDEGMPTNSRDHDSWLDRGEDRARRRGLDYLLDRQVGEGLGRSRGRAVGVRPDDRQPEKPTRDGQVAGLHVSAPESFDAPCQTEVRAATGDARRCGAPAREYRVYMNNTWQRWVICSTHAAYYRSWGADLSVLVD